MSVDFLSPALPCCFSCFNCYVRLVAIYHVQFIHSKNSFAKRHLVKKLIAFVPTVMCNFVRVKNSVTTLHAERESQVNLFILTSPEP